jgi:hypothetical protein
MFRRRKSLGPLLLLLLLLLLQLLKWKRGKGSSRRERYRRSLPPQDSPSLDLPPPPSSSIILLLSLLVQSHLRLLSLLLLLSMDLESFSKTRQPRLSMDPESKRTSRSRIEGVGGTLRMRRVGDWMREWRARWESRWMGARRRRGRRGCRIVGFGNVVRICLLSTSFYRSSDRDSIGSVGYVLQGERGMGLCSGLCFLR